MPSALQALEALKEGNRRFAEGEIQHVQDAVTQRREAFAERQAPVAAVLGCSDSRVPPEIIFDQGLGELFVIRVAGNIANPSQLGSVEFAVQVLGVRLVLVLGHTSCGAVQATLEGVLDPHGPPSPGLASIVEAIQPSVEPLVRETGSSGDLASELARLMPPSVVANVRQAVAVLRSGLAPAPAEADGRIRPILVTGAVYDVDTGKVAFLDD